MKRLEGLFDFWGVFGEDNRGLLRFLIRTDKQLDEFMNYFYAGDILKDMMSYKHHMRERNKVNLSQFKVIYVNDRRVSLELILQEPVPEHLIQFTYRHEVTYTRIYKNLEDFPFESAKNIITSNLFSKSVNTSDDILLRI